MCRQAVNQSIDQTRCRSALIPFNPSNLSGSRPSPWLRSVEADARNANCTQVLRSPALHTPVDRSYTVTHRITGDVTFGPPGSSATQMSRTLPKWLVAVFKHRSPRDRVAVTIWLYIYIYIYIYDCSNSGRRPSNESLIRVLWQYIYNLLQFLSHANRCYLRYSLTSVHRRGGTADRACYLYSAIESEDMVPAGVFICPITERPVFSRYVLTLVGLSVIHTSYFIVVYECRGHGSLPHLLDDNDECCVCLITGFESCVTSCAIIRTTATWFSAVFSWVVWCWRLRIRSTHRSNEIRSGPGDVILRNGMTLELASCL